MVNSKNKNDEAGIIVLIISAIILGLHIYTGYVSIVLAIIYWLIAAFFGYCLFYSLYVKLADCTSFYSHKKVDLLPHILIHVNMGLVAFILWYYSPFISMVLITILICDTIYGKIYERRKRRQNET